LELSTKHGFSLNENMPNKQKNIIFDNLKRRSASLLKAGTSIPESQRTALQNILMETIVKNQELLGFPPDVTQ